MSFKGKVFAKIWWGYVFLQPTGFYGPAMPIGIPVQVTFVYSGLLSTKGLSGKKDYNYLWGVHSFDVEKFEFSAVLFLLLSSECVVSFCWGRAWVLTALSHLTWTDFRIKVKRIAHFIVHFDQWNKLISKIHWALFMDAEVAEVKRPRNSKRKKFYYEKW